MNILDKIKFDQKILILLKTPSLVIVCIIFNFLFLLLFILLYVFTV